MSDNGNEAEEEMANAIFISADCWLCVFDLLPPSQLGFGISMISRRFDFYVDEHFKTRKWALKFIRIRRKIGKNGTKGMEIINLDGEPMPIPQIQMPRKVSGFKWIITSFIDRNVIAFLRRFCQLFAASPITLSIHSNSDRVLDFILRNIWPLLGKNIYAMRFLAGIIRRLGKFVPSIFNECPSLRIVSSDFDDLFTEFRADGNAMASVGQALANWLFTPRPDNVPKMLKCSLDMDDGRFESRIRDFKAAFSNASSPVNFIVSVSFPWFFAASVVPFELTNELTREQLTLKRMNDIRRVLLIRCPIARDESKWTKWEEEAIGWQFNGQWNKIDIHINEDIGDGLLDETPGPSDQPKK